MHVYHLAEKLPISFFEHSFSIFVLYLTKSIYLFIVYLTRFEKSHLGLFGSEMFKLEDQSKKLVHKIDLVISLF